MKRLRLSLALTALLALPAAPPAHGQDAPAKEPQDAHAANRLLGRGINLGNALEAPREGEWGMTLEESYFEAIKQAGFDSVRIPIRWSAHAGDQPPYTIDPEFFERVDWAIDQALKRGLVAIINVHHFGEMDTDPDKFEPKLRALWTQVAGRYRDRPGTLYFELLNEPHEKLTPERWNRTIPALLEIVRATNPRRTVIVGPGMWNSLHELDKLALPEEDRRIIVTFHYYLPFPFTHQGAEWVEGSAKWLGTEWSGSPEQTKALRDDLDKAAAWAKAHDRPLFLGEFGAYSKADMPSRATWTAAVTREAERRGFSWAYWEFGSGFGAYDRQAKSWHGPLLKALLPAIGARDR